MALLLAPMQAESVSIKSPPMPQMGFYGGVFLKIEVFLGYFCRGFIGDSTVLKGVLNEGFEGFQYVFIKVFEHFLEFHRGS